MKRLVKLILLFITITFLNASELKHADSYESAISQGIKENKIVVLFAHHPQCPYCRKMESTTLSNKDVIKVLNEQFIFLSVDLTLDIEVDDVPMEFIPQGTPTTYIIDPRNEEKLYSLRGYKNTKSFLKRLNRL